jgi:lipopolysaccharide export system permease protein
MMKLNRLDRYLGGEFIKGFILALIGLLLVFLSVSINEALKIESKQPKYLLYMYLLTTIPQLIVTITPAAIMFSVCFVVAQFTMARELVAIFASGISFYRAVAVIFVFSFLLSAALIVFQNYVVVPSNRISLEYLENYRKNAKRKIDAIWQRSFRGRKAFYFVQYLDRESHRIMGGFHILFFDPETTPPRPVRMIEAKSAVLTGNREWRLQLVRETLFDETLNVAGVKLHLELPVILDEDLSFFTRPRRDPSELDLAGLLDEIQRLESAGFSATEYRVHFHATIAFPFMCFIVAIVGSIAGNMGSLRSGGPLIRALLLSTATIFFYIVSIRIGQNLGENHIVPPYVAGWAPTTVFALISVVLVIKHRR